jgi:hypothetical protein
VASGSHAPAWEPAQTLRRRVTHAAGAAKTAFPRGSTTVIQACRLGRRRRPNTLCDPAIWRQPVAKLAEQARGTESSRLGRRRRPNTPANRSNRHASPTT